MPATALAGGGGGFGFEAVRQLASVADVNRLLHEASARERAIDAELEQLLARRGDLEACLVQLHTSTEEMLQVMRAEAESLAGSTGDTSALAEKVSRKVRQLDGAQSRVTATLGHISVVLDRLHAVEGIQTALQREDYEAAADCVARYLELEDELNAGVAAAAAAGGDGAAEPDSRQAAEQAKVLVEGRAKLEEIVRARGRAAAKAGDHADVVRFTRLTRPLRLQQEGLELLTGFLRRMVGERARADFDALLDSFAGGEGGGGRGPDYLGTLTNLFKDVASAIDEHLDLIKEAFGTELGLMALQAIHTECDVHGTRLLQRYADYRRLARIAGQIGMRKRDDTTAEAAPVEPRQVEAFLEELLLLCQRSEEYTQFLLARMAEVAAPGALPPARETALRGGAFSSAVRELLSYYISLEEYYMEESVAKAIRIDETVADSATSSMVDDSFFVLLKAGRRSMGTGKAPSVVAILNQINSTLSSLYRNALAAKLAGASGRLVGAAPAELGEPPGPAAAASAAAFNNAEVSSGYVGKLRQQLEDLAAQIFYQANDRDRIKLVLADLGKTASDFRQITTKALDQLCGGLMPRLRPVLDEAASASYELGEGDLVPGGGPAGSAWPQALLLAFGVHLGWLQPLLTPAGYDALVHLVLDKVVARLEAVLSQKRFTQLGGMQLEKDVRLLVGGLSDVTARTVRDKFARLSQMATLLTLESVSEVLDYWGDAGAIAWRLTDGDVRQTLSQRVDFAPHDILALKL
ncbi:conserved oligomeric Golgi complex subunit 4 isoform B [Micractinium conductrix]|uniref:Conserved oligomeric Golgi complex subunit 4 n=1 Tax=Micractinium conductrix TaxID=554055 RepID=A0A2P6VDZ1_9CHLO|nr:conserved oligomeric Golgi complex subunit 4 isoform B [Micractinium conductrix]|eukprot:PSC72320.1 conserved oligomeric Golgi complex subunit 4 isoform B [Micractinium conductrix]